MPFFVLALEGRAARSLRIELAAYSGITFLVTHDAIDALSLATATPCACWSTRRSGAGCSPT